MWCALCVYTAHMTRKTICRKRHKTPVEKQQCSACQKCCLYSVDIYTWLLWRSCDVHTYNMGKSQNGMWRVCCLLLCITSIVGMCPPHSASSGSGIACLCEVGFFADTASQSLSCLSCPGSYDADELTEAHATGLSENCIEVFP